MILKASEAGHHESLILAQERAGWEVKILPLGRVQALITSKVRVQSSLQLWDQFLL